MFIKQLIGYITDRPVSYPAYRTRIHYGHESQTSDMSSSYYQGWFLRNGSVAFPRLKTIYKPVCLLINRYDNNISDRIAAMQNEGIAKVVADGNLGNFEPYGGPYPMELSDSVKVNLHLSEVVYANGSKTFSPNVNIIRNDYKNDDTLICTAVDLLKSKKELKKTILATIQKQFAGSKVAGYDSLAYPSASLRLLGLARYWSAINYFCPNKDRIVRNWDSVLYEYVPKFLGAKDSIEYVLAAARLIKQINDTHGYLTSSVFRRLIAKAPPLQLKYVNDKTIVYKLFNDSLKQKLFAGDEIIAVDNMPVKKLRDSLAQYVSVSNEASLHREVNYLVLAGKENTSVKIKVLHNGKPVNLTLLRSAGIYQFESVPGEGPIWKKLNDKLGYVDLGRLEVAQIDSMFNDFKNVDVIIIDNRSYPKGTVWSIINYLTDKPVKAAKGATVVADSPDPLTVTVQESVWELPVTPKPQYKGKLVILVNEVTQSQAEYSCMVLQAACKNVTVIGSQTAGADGDVTGILLPGGIKTSFSGHGIHYSDGRPTQGIGIVPDIKIKPTIKGIKAGRDEVLERAILFAKTGK
ncbi:MAG: S41 family peptidase [Segetibacter sp.]